MKLAKIISAAFLSLIILPMISAYNGLSYYLRSPWEIIQNPWIFFILVFALFFAVTYFAIGKRISSKGPAAVISAVISLFIAAAISQRGWYYGILGEGVGSLIITLAIILGLILVIRALTITFGGIGLIATLFIGWLILSRSNIAVIIPYEFYTEVYPIAEFISSTTFLYVLIIGTVLLFAFAYLGKSESSKKLKDWIWGKRKQKSLFETLMQQKT